MEALIFAGLLGVGYIAKSLTSKTEGFTGDSMAEAPDAAEEITNETPAPASGVPKIVSPKSVAEVAAPLAKSVVRMNAGGEEKPPVYNTKPYTSALSGLTFAPGEFVHKNMQPFFKGGGIRQNMRDETNAATLDLYTGRGETHKHKKEIAPMFDTAKPYGNVFGSPSVTTFEQERIVGSKLRNNELPFEQIRVAPGLDDGYTAEGSGGFQQAYAEEVARKGYKDINELRPGNRPKIENDPLPFTAPKAVVTNRGLQASVNQNRPDRLIHNEGGEHNGGAFATVVKAATRAAQILLGTARQETTTDYTGIAGSAGEHASYTMGSYRDAHTIQHGPVPLAPAYASGLGPHDPDAAGGDYGKSGIDIPANERDITGLRTHLTGVSYPVEAGEMPMSAPIPTLKEEFIDNTDSGYVGGTTKSIVYDPTDLPKTTIKETNIHNTHTGTIGYAEGRGAVYDPSQKARTTVKQTTINNRRTGDVGGVATAGVVYDPDDITRTTGRETLDAVETVVNSTPGVYMNVVYDPSDVARVTVRQTTENDGRVGVATGARKTVVFDPDSIAKRTLRNMNADIDPWLNTAPAGGQAAASVRYPDEVRPTQKAVLSNNEHVGVAGSVHAAPRSQAAERGMRTNPIKEKLVRGRTPTRSGTKLASGKDAVCMRLKQPVTDDLDKRVPTKTRVSAATQSDIGRVRTRVVSELDDRNTDDMLSALASNPYATNIIGAL